MLSACELLGFLSSVTVASLPQTSPYVLVQQTSYLTRVSLAELQIRDAKDQLNGYTARPLRAAMQQLYSIHRPSRLATLPQLQAALLSSLAKSMQPCAGKYHHIYSLSDLMSLSLSSVAG